MTRVVDRIPERVFQRLCDWQFWMVLAFVGIGAGFVVQGLQNNKVNRQAAKQEAVQAAAYQACVQSIPGIRKFSQHVEGVNEFALILIQNSVASINAAAPNDPLKQTRLDNLERLQLAAAKIAAVKSIPTPTLAQCAKRRDALG